MVFPMKPPFSQCFPRVSYGFPLVSDGRSSICFGQEAVRHALTTEGLMLLLISLAWSGEPFGKDGARAARWEGELWYSKMD